MYYLYLNCIYILLRMMPYKSVWHLWECNINLIIYRWFSKPFIYRVSQKYLYANFEGEYVCFKGRSLLMVPSFIEICFINTKVSPITTITYILLYYLNSKNVMNFVEFFNLHSCSWNFVFCTFYLKFISFVFLFSYLCVK